MVIKLNCKSAASSLAEAWGFAFFWNIFYKKETTAYKRKERMIPKVKKNVTIAYLQKQELFFFLEALFFVGFFSL